MHAHRIIALAGLALSSAAFAQTGTAFTYQGQLKDASSPATGLFDLRFRLLDAAAGGGQVGSTLCADDVAVEGGIFTVSLDFGDQFSRGNELFLEVDVRSDTGLTCADTTGYVSLSPRQAMTISPFAGHAIQARSAVSAETADNATNAAALAGQSQAFYRSATNLNAGTLADARLSPNVALLNGSQVFTGAVTMTNALNSFAGTGAGLTGLNASNLATGVVSDARLSANIARLGATQVFTGATTFSNASSSFTGDGAGLSNLNAAALTGFIPAQSFGGTYFNTVSLTNTNNTITGTHSGNGSGLTGLNASNFTVGVLAAARGGTGSQILSANIGEVLKWNGAAFTAQPDLNTTYSAGAGLSLIGTTFSIGPNQVTGSMLAPNTVSSANIIDHTIGAVDILSGAVGSTELAFDATSLIRVSGGAISSSGANIGIGIAAGADRLQVNGNTTLSGNVSIAGASTLSGNVGIGGAPTATRLNVVGNANVTGIVTATGFTTPATAKSLILSAADFVGDAKVVFDGSGINHTNLHLLTCGSSVSATEAYAGIHLPDGAVITAMTASIIDSSVLSNTSVAIFRRTPANVDVGGTVASISSSGSDSAIRTFSDTTISGGSINNATSMYYVRVTFPIGASIYIDNPNLVAVRIDYTTTAP